MAHGKSPNTECPSGFERIRQQVVCMFLVWLVHRTCHCVDATSKISTQQTWIAYHHFPSEGLWTLIDIPVWVTFQLPHSQSNIWSSEAWGKPAEELRIFTLVFISRLIWHQKEVSTSLAPQGGWYCPSPTPQETLSQCHLVLNDYVITFVNVILQGIILIIAYNPFQLHSEK